MIILKNIAKTYDRDVTFVLYCPKFTISSFLRGKIEKIYKPYFKFESMCWFVIKLFENKTYARVYRLHFTR